MRLSIGPGATALTRMPDGPEFQGGAFHQSADRVFTGDVGCEAARTDHAGH